MSNSFEMAWGIVKGQSSDFDWFKPGWERMTLNERKRQEMGGGDNYGAGLQWGKRGVPTRRESELDVQGNKSRIPDIGRNALPAIASPAHGLTESASSNERREATERGLERDIEDDASTNPNPAINDALTGIGESPTMPNEYREDIWERQRNAMQNSPLGRR